MRTQTRAIGAVRNTGRIWTLFLLIGPAFILFTLLVVVPVFQAEYYSLYRWNGLGPLADLRWFNNFVTLAKDVVFRKALLHNVYIVLISLAVELPIALGLAVVVSRSDLRLAVFFRTFFFLPYVLSEIITGVLWQFIYHPQFGLVKAIAALLVPGGPSPAWLGDQATVLPAIMVVIVWKYFGLHMTIYIAGLQEIPKELEEAATIDGATGAQIFRYVTFPLLQTTIQISVFFSIIGSFQIFDVIWAMGKGDPVNAAETMVTYLYKFGLQRFQIGYGGAVAVSIFVICLTFSILYRRLLAREER